MMALDVLLLVTGILWLASFAFGCYRVWVHTHSFPLERLRQLWQEELRLYGSLPEGLRRPEELEEAWERWVVEMAAEPFPLLSRLLSRRRFVQWLEREIRRAHVSLDAISAVAIMLVTAVIGFSFTAIAASALLPSQSPLLRFLLAFSAAFLGPALLLAWLRYCQRRYIQRVELVLSDTLALMANALRAGMGFQQAMELVAREGLPPLREEFATATRAITLGASLEEALQGVAERVPSAELSLVITAVLIQREVGGSLARLLETASETVRNRLRLRQEIRAETSMTRASAFALAFGLPALVFLFANFATIVTGSEPWSAPMFTTSAGLQWWGVIALLEIGGWLWLQQVLARLEG